MIDSYLIDGPVDRDVKTLHELDDFSFRVDFMQLNSRRRYKQYLIAVCPVKCENLVALSLNQQAISKLGNEEPKGTHFTRLEVRDDRRASGKVDELDVKWRSLNSQNCTCRREFDRLDIAILFKPDVSKQLSNYLLYKEHG